MNPRIFREYDIRGIVGEDLTLEIVREIGQGFGTFMAERGAKTVAIGRDNRLSSPSFKESLIEGLVSVGREVVDVDQLPTPALYFAVVHLGVDAGVMITASHNPKEFNGIKLRLKDKAIYGQEIQHLKELIQRQDFPLGQGSYRSEDIIDIYKETLKERVKIERGLKVVVDAGNGTTGPIATSLLEELGCEVVELYCEPDGNFPHHLPDPTVEAYLIDLASKVKEERADLGVAYDGDGDRFGIVDEEGQIVWADMILVLFSRDILKREPAHVVFDVKCSQALIEEIEKSGGIPIMGKTGYPNIQQKMLEVDALLAGEMSGHIYFRDRYLGFDDGIYASLRLLELLSKEKKPVSSLIASIPRYCSTPEIRMASLEDEKFEVVEKVAAYFKENYQTIDVDGARILFDDGWALIRASNTQPIIVLRFEAKTEERLAEIKELVASKLKEYSSTPVEF